MTHFTVSLGFSFRQLGSKCFLGFNSRALALNRFDVYLLDGLSFSAAYSSVAHI
jgi:hypothetical protein